ncbi:Lrp/AsnC ligand binding domain-containing protein [Halalkalicoccus sp. NIPERK01]|uniref:Lrp/AsnC ligand binding domain-containing protein n=1 Tax=Halalkalicoccus sp. NIPERK01 TaxID=3053469 RepID=UPI00256ECCDC|nr:Lrp/AsnC ligand binding domain-containing protein [Halalkalicoccus sp. NIPERK01]MDL5363344.1 Lrp/AsnC ligand binding domain-containing protein [Halalkalicoccus sp. NIPERK01]
MVKAYVMVITAAGTTPAILPEATKIDGVIEAHAIAGEYDVIVEVETEELSDLLPTITSQLQEIEGVGTTKTYITVS